MQHAREGKPEEICGIVRGRGLDAFEAVRGRNVAAERIENYTVDPQTLLKQFDFEDEGDEMMGIYHSHPVSVAYPSATDAWNAAYPDSIYLICSLEDDGTPVIRAFRMIPHFIDLDLAALTAALDFYETRPGLFAYYADPAQPPAIFANLPDVIAPPFYVVYFEDSADDFTRPKVGW
ncbi:MAG: M67 family metallopeptidase [Caldilineaceae bacterium]